MVYGDQAKTTKLIKYNELGVVKVNKVGSFRQLRQLNRTLAGSRQTCYQVAGFS
jgi:hypothetical protein